jgi:hypothetical protein
MMNISLDIYKKKKHVLPARIFFIFFISNAPLYYHNVVELKLSLSRGFYVFFI